MRYSICNWIFGDIPFEEVFARVSEAGYHYMDAQASVVSEHLSQMQSLTERYSVKISGLLGGGGWPSEEHDLANTDRHNRNKAVDYVKQQIELVKKVDADYLVIVPSALGKYWLMGNDKSDDWNWGIESVTRLTETAEEYGVTLVVEPVNRYECSIVNSSEDALNFVKEINHPHVKALLDTFHMNIEEANFEEAFIKLKDWLEVVHFADNNRQGLGKGNIDFTKIVAAMKKIGFNKTVVLECMAPGANPFQAHKGEDTPQIISAYAKESLEKMKEWFA